MRPLAAIAAVLAEDVEPRPVVSGEGQDASASSLLSTGLGLVLGRDDCSANMWGAASALPTAALAGGVLFGVLAGLDMKAAEGLARPARLARAMLLKCASSICIVQVLANVELTVEWSIFTLFELLGVVAGGVALYGERVGPLKGLGVALSSLGIVLLEEVAGRRPAAAEGANRGCEVLVNLPALFLAFSLLLALLWSFAGSPAAPPAPERPQDFTDSPLRHMLVFRTLCATDRHDGRPRPSVPPVDTCSSAKALAGDATASRQQQLSRLGRLATSVSWLALTAASEVATAYFMKEARGLSGWRDLAAACGLGLLSTLCCACALRHGTLAAAWTAESAFEYLGVVLVAALYFGEPTGRRRLAGVAVTAVGLVCLAGGEE